MKTVVFIDGENTLKKILGVYRKHRWAMSAEILATLPVRPLLDKLLPGQKQPVIKYYLAKLHSYPETKAKSAELIALQRALKSRLEHQRVEVILSGNVRRYPVGDGKHVFKEKGVDVRLAVDAVSMAADKKMTTAVLMTSDSDMQPVVSELRRRGVRVLYVGFQAQPNKGLMYTCQETMLIRDHELKSAFDATKLKIRRFDG